MNKKILDIALPSIVSNITVPLLGLVDTAIVGHLGAAAYIGAIAVGGMLFNMVYWLFGFLRMGTGGMTAQAQGAKDTVETFRILFRALGVAGCLSVFLILLQVPILQVAFHFIEATEEVKSLSTIYFNILIWGAPAVLGLYGLIGWFLGKQNAKYPMVIAIVQNVVNISASLFFVLGCGWKVEGVATGTLIAQYAGFLLAIVLWWRRYHRELPSNPITGIWKRADLGRFFSVNRDIFLRTLCLISVTTYFTSAGAAQGDVILAVNALLMQFFVLFSYVMDGFAYAGEAIGGLYFGAKDKQNFSKFTIALFKWGLGLSFIFTLAYWGLGSGFLGILTDDKVVLATAGTYLPYAIAIPFLSFMAFLYDGLFIGTTSTRGMLIAVAGASVGFFVCKFTLFSWLGNHALWIAFLLYLLLRGVIQWGYYGRIERKL